jgi:catechol 2,3-dioxygenase-like lactoylglutathione lyase family enzyme
MKQELGQIAIVVDDYDKAIEFYTQKLGFELVEDSMLSPTKRWVLVQPKNATGCKLLLAKAANEEQASRIGNQTGGRVFLFLNTDDFRRDYDQYKANGVEFVRDPVDENWGTVAVFKDIYGNLWDLIGVKEQIL